MNQSLDKMVSFSPEDVIFLLNKWDTIAHESVQKLENFFEQSKKSLHKNWEKVDDSCIFRISAKKVSYCLFYVCKEIHAYILVSNFASQD